MPATTTKTIPGDILKTSGNIRFKMAAEKNERKLKDDWKCPLSAGGGISRDMWNSRRDTDN